MLPENNCHRKNVVKKYCETVFSIYVGEKCCRKTSSENNCRRKNVVKKCCGKVLPKNRRLILGTNTCGDGFKNTVKLDDGRNSPVEIASSTLNVRGSGVTPDSLTIKASPHNFEENRCWINSDGYCSNANGNTVGGKKPG